MNNIFVNAILAIAGMAVVISLGILNMVTTPPHGFELGLLGFVFSIVLLGVLTVLYAKKPATGWVVLVVGTLLLYLVGGPHLFINSWGLDKMTPLSFISPFPYKTPKFFFSTGMENAAARSSATMKPILWRVFL